MCNIKKGLNKEIERKFLINGFPTNLKIIKEANIEQGYLLSNSTEVRVRHSDNISDIPYIMTIKDSGTLSRTEIEEPISKEFYDNIKTFIDKPFINKVYKIYELEDGHLLQCSKVDDEFYYAEVEFSSLEHATMFNASKFLYFEVTYDAKYKMKNYWRRTRLNKNESDILDKKLLKKDEYILIKE